MTSWFSISLDLSHNLSFYFSQCPLVFHRIDANVDDAEMNVEAAHHELLKYFKSVSSNRMLMIKVFGIMIVFFVIFVVFMAWGLLYHIVPKIFYWNSFLIFYIPVMYMHYFLSNITGKPKSAWWLHEKSCDIFVFWSRVLIWFLWVMTWRLQNRDIWGELSSGNNLTLFVYHRKFHEDHIV